MSRNLRFQSIQCNLHANYLVRILFAGTRLAGTLINNNKIYNVNFLAYNSKDDGDFTIKPPS